ncbi:hypothetical protein [Shewanella frigidimarina]|uniref:hypothetical protein n=1 Tax=Shewanella frigidimarina TaxID=56812 RepID=UPI003D795348
MNKYASLISIVLLSTGLTACGGSDSNELVIDSGNTSSNGGGSSSSEQSVFMAPTGELAQKMLAINTSASNNSVEAKCSTTGNVYETTDLYVGFSSGANSNKYDADLVYAAQLTQAALNELIVVTGLDKNKDLSLDGQNKWTICLDNNKTGNGTGSIASMTYSPSALDADGFKLAKHELFHVVQTELLGQNTIYHHLPRWFQEGSAEYFASMDPSNVSRSLLVNFTNDLAGNTSLQGLQSAYGINTYNHQQAILEAYPQYDNKLYSIYKTSVNYLIDKGLTDQALISLIRNSYQAGQDPQTMPQFHSEIAMLQATGAFTLPSGYDYTDLLTTEGYSELILNDWLNTDQYSASFTSVSATVSIARLFLIPTQNQDNEYEITVNSDQSGYSYAVGSIPDGDYQIYAIDSADINVYGPISQSVINGELGNVDFTGVKVCESCND